MRIFRLKSRIGRKELHLRLEGLDAVAIRCDSVSSLEEPRLAFHLAKNAFRMKTNIARRLRYEFLLWLSGKTDIKSAMAATVPEGDEFFLVVFSDSEPEIQNRRLKTGNRLPETVCRLLDAEQLPLGLGKEAEPLALERISLSRLRG